MTTETLSVVIAVRDDVGRLPRAIESVRRQDRGDIEVIVVDDASTDGTSEAATEHGADQVIRLRDNVGPSLARNIGLARASGELVTILDADDRMLPERARRQEEWLTEHPDAGGVLADYRIEVEPGVSLPSWMEPSVLELADSGGMPISAMLRMRCLLQFGGFNPELRMAEDMELLMRLDRAGAPVGRIEEVLTIKTLHGKNATYATEAMLSGLLHVVHRLADPAPTISVVIPVFNNARYLEQAVASILVQGAAGLEIVIVDDGSSDEFVAVAARLTAAQPAVRVVHQPRGGAGAARNLGLLVARGRYVAFLDADDLWTEGRLGAQMDMLDRDQTLDMVFGDAEEFVSPDAPPDLVARLRPRSRVQAHVSSTMVARRGAVAAVGPFSSGAEAAEWPEWYIRAVEHGLKLGSVPDVVARRRLHGSNHSFVHDTIHHHYFDLLRGSIARRRAGP